LPPKALTSVTAIPPIPISAKACWTASNLKGLMTASIFSLKQIEHCLCQFDAERDRWRSTLICRKAK
jgi:hypothetical protein